MDELQASFDRWEASFDALCRYLLDTGAGVTEPVTANSDRSEVILAPAGMPDPLVPVPASCRATITTIVGPVQLSSDSTDLVSVPVGLAEPPVRILIMEESLVVAPAVPNATSTVAPTCCSTEGISALVPAKCSTECIDMGVVDITKRYVLMSHEANTSCDDLVEDQQPPWPPPPLVLVYVLTELQHDKIQWQPWPPPLSVGNIRTGHMFRSKLLSSFEGNQEGIQSGTRLVQSWLVPSSRPQQYAHSPGTNHVSSVFVLAHPSGDPLCKLLSPQYQEFGDNCGILLTLELEKQAYVGASGCLQHIILQSDIADIYQVLTQSGVYLSVWLQPKPPWLYILIKLDTEAEERGVHRHVEELTSVQLLSFKLLLRRPYSELPNEICMHELHLTRRGMRAAELLSKDINFQLEAMSSVDRLLLQRYIFIPTWKLFEVRFLNSILLHDWLVSWFIGHVTQCCFEILQWKIAWSRQLERSEIVVRLVFIIRFRPPELYPLLDNMKHNTSTTSPQTLILAYVEVSGVVSFAFWSQFGTTVMLIWSSQIMSLLEGSEQGSNIHELSLTLFSVSQQVKYTQFSWDPGIRELLGFSDGECEKQLQYCPRLHHNYGPFHGGRCMPALGRHKEFRLRWDLGGAATICSQRTFDVRAADIWDQQPLETRLSYFRDSYINKHRLQWDPGRFLVMTAWGQAAFQGGRGVRSLSYIHTHMGWPSEPSSEPSPFDNSPSTYTLRQARTGAS